MLYVIYICSQVACIRKQPIEFSCSHGSQPNISAVYVCSLQTTGMHVVLHHSIFAILVLRQDLQREICMLVGF